MVPRRPRLNVRSRNRGGWTDPPVASYVDVFVAPVTGPVTPLSRKGADGQHDFTSAEYEEPTQRPLACKSPGGTCNHSHGAAAAPSPNRLRWAL
jgi:hypothetical protein